MTFNAPRYKLTVTMRTSLIVIFFLIISFNLIAENPFQNDKEGKSRFYYGLMGKLRDDYGKKIEKIIGKEKLDELLTKVFNIEKADDVCETKIFEKLESELTLLNKKYYSKYADLVLYYARDNNFIDDISLRILLDSLKVSKLLVSYETSNSSEFDSTIEIKPWRFYKSEEQKGIIETFNRFKMSLKDNRCLSDSWLRFYSGVGNTFGKAPTSNTLSDVNNFLKETLKIEEPNYILLEQMRNSSLLETHLTLGGYYKKHQFIRNQFPPEEKELSCFVTQKSNINKYSFRENLYIKYDEIQITRLKEIVLNFKKLIENIDSMKIIAYDKDGNILREVEVDPVDHFRAAIRLMRKDLDDLQNSFAFSNVSINYIDLNIAAYETGIIKGNEIDEMAGLEDIWNPKKTFKEKTLDLTKRYGPLVSLFLPGWSALAVTFGIIVIDVFFTDTKVTDKPFSLF